MNAARWKALMQRLSLPVNMDVFDELGRAYGQRHRHYHTSEHIDHCLRILDEYSSDAERPDEIEVAIWFHDAIYKPLSKGNEARSADWAGDFLTAGGCPAETAQRVRNLIMATVHDAPATEPDAQLLVDIDLSVLGAEAESYDKFETDVRREYKWVPAPIYRRERRKILQSFLNRKAIFATARLHGRFEDRARANLQQAIDALSTAG